MNPTSPTTRQRSASRASVDANLPSNELRAVEAARTEVAQAFSADGALAGALNGFAPRSSQQEMALAVFDAIVERDTLVAEAGTGTGKTFAYLVPVLLAGGKALISTGTRALQDQVFHKDLLAVRRALGLRTEMALLKGRQNYLCLQRLARTESEGHLPSRQDVHYLRAVSRFARTSVSGDRAELAEVPEKAAIWPLVTSTRENCLGQECPRFSECFVMKARRNALAADVVVVNHHLFLADLALKDDAIRDFLPAADVVVLDEAHQLPKIATDFFGSGWSIAQLNDLAHDTKALGLARAADGASWVRLAQEIEAAGKDIRLALLDSGLSVGQRVALERLAGRARLLRPLQRLDQALAALLAALKSNEGRDAELDALAPRTEALRSTVLDWSQHLQRSDATEAAEEHAAEAQALQETETSDTDAQVRWLALSTYGAQFQASPLAPGATFARLREQQSQAWILTSATLTLAGRFEPFLAEVGLVEARTERWDSPFDFAQQGLLYLPKGLPSPQLSDFPERVAECAWPVIAAAGGRAFVLCSTLRAVERVARVLRDKARADGEELTVLEQGSSTRSALLDHFRQHGRAVLVGSVSFWEGIDVRGQALSLVVIDKLPFAPPDDPVVDARSRRLRALGKNPFTEYQLPQAVTLLKQGVGRLIRDENDRGVLMILDDRLLTKSYGKTVLASLPPFSRTRDLAQACAFFEAPVV